VIVFVGVNGVGKSTNLAKVAYKLKNAKLSVMLAACDNFRAGAVEQIETHGRNLEIPVFQKGYKEEPAVIAYEAIKDVPSPLLRRPGSTSMQFWSIQLAACRTTRR
jgi:signal recognition particle receptor subunit alpha